MGLLKNQDAQFMLLAGFIIAVGLVVATIMLNNVIFESNTASESGIEPAKYDMVNLVQITKYEMQSAYRNVTNVSGSTKPNQTANFSNQMTNFSTHLSKIYAMHGENAKVTWDIRNWNDTPPRYANFTENGTIYGKSDWTLIEGVRNTSVFGLSSRGVNGYFLINVTNSTGRIWSMNLTGDPNIVIINNTGGTSSYTDVYANLDLLNTTYGFNSSTANQNYSINFVRGNNSWGSYSIEGNYTAYNKKFTIKRDYIFNATLTLSTKDLRTNITIPVSVPW